MTNANGIPSGYLKSVIDRVENLEEQKSNISADINEIFSEAKGEGFDVKIIKQIIKIRKMEESDRSEQEALLALYMNALGMTL